jgi:hypothetical protein
MEANSISETHSGEDKEVTFNLSEEKVEIPESSVKNKKIRSEAQKQQFIKAREKRIENALNRKNSSTIPETTIVSSPVVEKSIIPVEKVKKEENDEENEIYQLINEKLKEKKKKWLQKLIKVESSSEEESYPKKKTKFVSKPETITNEINTIIPVKNLQRRQPAAYFI